jgi:AcrR family transcriptional regulator
MTPLDGSRPGGRSARIQQAVHDSTRELLLTTGRDDLSIPAIAAHSGVNPTTVYRRWGDLAALLSDVAADRFRETEPPVETGSLTGDLSLWAEHFLEEMGSGPGRSYVADVLAGDINGENTGICARYAADAISQILARFSSKTNPAVDEIIDHVVAPILYRILFTKQRPEAGYGSQLVGKLLGGTQSYDL